MQALTRAADRGVKARNYIGGTQLAERKPAKAFRDPAETPPIRKVKLVLEFKCQTSLPAGLQIHAD
jgi:hypothetical protein